MVEECIGCGSMEMEECNEEYSYNDRHEKSIGLIQVSADTVSILAFV